jgi:hypothetical protein
MEKLYTVCFLQQIGYYGSRSFSSLLTISRRNPTYKTTRCHRQTVNVIVNVVSNLCLTNYWCDKIDEDKIGREGSTIGRKI